MWNTDCIYDSGCKGKVKKIQMAEKILQQQSETTQ